MRKRHRRPSSRKIVLKLPDLDQTKSAVLNSLSSPHSRRNYKFAMEQFITWYCSEPRLSLNRAVVLRFRLHLESLGLAAGTVNQRLAAVRRLAYEAADSGLRSPELAAGIRRVKGVKQLGARTGNWLTQDQARLLLQKADGDDLRSVRDLAMISVLVGCGLRRAELSSLTVEDLQIGRDIGTSWTWLAKGVMFVPFPCRLGSSKQSIAGENQRRWPQAESFERLAATERRGARGSPRTLFGTSSEGALSVCNGTIWRRMTSGEPARSSAI